ncbi:hypothetical protein Acr_00g0032110 [Actinidia rufa]|uniref:Uncharacterized protein n=1 Tax=Actinidia rufa TaxID=165716 RepID=A0A7J0DF94_9ERIC|nr:hypothetical protein Acr_00g0032110 [Actinidia rufa]
MLHILDRKEVLAIHLILSCQTLKPSYVAKAKNGLVVGGPVGGKRGHGRFPRPKLLPVLIGQSGPERRPGHPRRTPPIGSVGVPRPRGQPEEDGTVMKALGRLRGWPPKNAVAVVTAGCDVGIAAVGVVVLPGKWQARKHRHSSGGNVPVSDTPDIRTCVGHA